jgi:hypothetical protein
VFLAAGFKGDQYLALFGVLGQALALQACGEWAGTHTPPPIGKHTAFHGVTYLEGVGCSIHVAI